MFYLVDGHILHLYQYFSIEGYIPPACPKDIHSKGFKVKKTAMRFRHQLVGLRGLTVSNQDQKEKKYCYI